MSLPIKFKSPEELQEKINGYFAMCDELNKPYTITGMALYLDTTRVTLLDYKGKPKFKSIVSKAKLKCENYAEEQLYTNKHTIGIIFNLKNNYGWQDKTELEHSGANGSELKVNIKVVE